jgi:hypothetical protein
MIATTILCFYSINISQIMHENLESGYLHAMRKMLSAFMLYDYKYFEKSNANLSRVT